MTTIPSGSPEGITLRGTRYFVWWGKADDYHDGIATEGGKAVWFATEVGCRIWATREGLADSGAETGILDCDALRPWLNRTSTTLDYGIALNALNMGIDFAWSLGRSWDPRNGHTRTVYDKLFAQSVPWFFGLESFTPRWSPHQLKVARNAVATALTLMTRALAP